MLAAVWGQGGEQSSHFAFVSVPQIGDFFRKEFHSLGAGDVARFIESLPSIPLKRKEEKQGEIKGGREDGKLRRREKEKSQRTHFSSSV